MAAKEDKDKDKNVNFEMSRGDLEAVSEATSATVPNIQFFGKTAFTIENAPIPKSIQDAIGVEKTITVQMKIKLEKGSK